MSISESSLRAAILIISDTASADPSTDKSTSILTSTIRSDSQWHVDSHAIVPDDISAIQSQIKSWADEEHYMNLIVTSGGTGFAIKDKTPEAVRELLQKEAPGLVHGLLKSSLEVTSFAIMSRPVAGVRNKTIIVTLPGSPKGAKENLLSILKLLPHACMQAAGVDSRALHSVGLQKLEEEAGLSSSKQNQSLPHHHHHHGHNHSHGFHGSHGVPKAHTKPEERLQSNDPSQGPTRRHRSSPYPMLPVSSAVPLILEHTPQATPISLPVNVSLTGYVLAEDVRADEAVPAYCASIVDGYAIIVPESGHYTKGIYPVAAVSHAAPGIVPALEPGQIARITTGAPLPPGANSVVMVEDTVLRGMTEDGNEEKEIEILTDEVKVRENVREIGSDVQIGDIILQKGEEITATGGELGLLASVGKAEVLVYRKPIVGVLSTGDEIVNHDRSGPLRMGEVRDSNRPTLMAAVRGWGFEVIDLGMASDTPGALEHSLRVSMRRVDVIITTGGVSMGELDLLKPTIERSLGGIIHFGRVAMKPGKPTTFATMPFKSNNGDPETRLIFALPGNPASAVVTAHLFVLPALQRASGIGRPGLQKVRIVLKEGLKRDTKRDEYHRAVVSAAEDGRLYAESTGGQRSSRVGSLRSANALLCLTAGEGEARRGECVEALLMVGVRGM